jgi:hypothetical protein
MQAEMWDVMQRYQRELNENPEWAATLCIDLADSLRETFELEPAEITDHGGGVHTVAFGNSDIEGFLNAPRSGDYMDIDEEALNDKVDQ